MTLLPTTIEKVDQTRGSSCPPESIFMTLNNPAWSSQSKEMPPARPVVSSVMFTPALVNTLYTTNSSVCCSYLLFLQATCYELQPPTLSTCLMVDTFTGVDGLVVTQGVMFRPVRGEMDSEGEDDGGALLQQSAGEDDRQGHSKDIG